jgi:S1-C subfamily serine protease
MRLFKTVAFTSLVVLPIMALILLFVSARPSENPYNIDVVENLPPLGDLSKALPPIYTPVVQLGKVEKDMTYTITKMFTHAKPKIYKFCSGTVIDNNYILTAAHCVTTEDGYRSKDDILIFNEHGEDTDTVVKVVGIDRMSDVALLKGDLHSFQFMGVDLFNTPFQTGGPFLACGFPRLQNRLICSNITDLSTFYFQYAAKGNLYPGMSGGPVVDMSKGMPILVAVNTAVTFNQVVVSPVIGLTGTFHLGVDIR